MFITFNFITFTISDPVAQIRLQVNRPISNEWAIRAPGQIANYHWSQHINFYLNVPTWGTPSHDAEDSSDASEQLLRPLQVEFVGMQVVPSSHQNMSSLSQVLLQNWRLSSSDMSMHCRNPSQSQSSVMQIKESSHLVTPVLCVQFSHLTGSSSYPSSQFTTPLHQSKVLFIHLRHKKGIKDFASIFEVMVEEDLECVRDAVKNVLANFFP